jgi:hypothetical protein
MSIPLDDSDKPDAAPQVLFSHAFVGIGRPNLPISIPSINPTASAISFRVKNEPFLSDDFVAPRLSNALPSHVAAGKPQRSFPLLGGWGHAAKPPAASSAPSEIVVGGVTLAFPFPPYPSQVCLANQMIRAFKLRKHALLESPTGTGIAAQFSRALIYSPVASRQVTRHSVLQHIMAAI